MSHDDRSHADRDRVGPTSSIDSAPTVSIGSGPAASTGSGPAASTGFDYDVLVIGSGFGGSVTALRRTEKGYRVGVLEAGQRFTADP
jgi:cholesterol oxidase